MDQDSSPAPDSSETRHPIKVVALRTGLSADVIRVWERRYAAVRPVRVGGGRRLYSDADIERLAMLRRGTLAGRRISDLASLAVRELRVLLDGDAQEIARRAPNGPQAPLLEDASSSLAEAKQCVRSLDPQALAIRIARAGVEFSTPRLLTDFAIPLIDWIGEAWRNGEIRVVHEHMATAVLSSALHCMLGDRPGSLNAPELVAATPRGHLHELGALLASLTAAAEGWRVCYLGTDLPVEEIAAAVAQRGARALALSAVYPADDPSLPAELQRLRRMIGPRVELFVGGRAAPAYASAVEAVRGRLVADFGAFRLDLEALRLRPDEPPVDGPQERGAAKN